MSTPDLVDDYSLFDPHAYLSTYYADVGGDPSEGDMLTKEMKFLHEAFSDGKISGRRLLDIGTGPTIHSIISASSHVDDIILSDFAQQNREVLKKWLDGSLGHSFENFFKYVIELEEKEATAKCKEAELRDKVSAIVQVDLTQGDPLTPSLFKSFDVITSSLCFEAVAQNLTEYWEMVKRATSLLKPDGYFVVFGVLGEKFYQVGNLKFRTLEIYKDDVKRIWEACGMEIVDIKQGSHSSPDQKSNSDFSGYFLMVTRKKAGK